MDRAVQWSSQVRLQMLVAIDAGVSPFVAGQPVLSFGRDAALAPFPLHQLVQTMTATINDTSVVINTDSVLSTILHLCDYKANRLSRTCPTMLDKYANYNDAYLAVNSPLASYLDATESAEVPNGAWYDLQFTKPDGGVLGAGPDVYASGALAVGFINGIPVRTGTPGLPAAPAGSAYVVDGVQAYPLFIQFRSTEKLVLSPFIFADAAEWETGLFGVNNIQLVCNMKASGIDRVIRSTTAGGRTVSGVAYNTATPFLDAKMNVQYLTPSQEVPLPPKSIVPYLEFPRYLTTGTNTGVSAQDNFEIRSQTIVLPQIPDSLIVFVKPQTYGATEGDWYYPIRKITVNFDKEAFDPCFTVAVAA